jgi:hypothetical protein
LRYQLTTYDERGRPLARLQRVQDAPALVVQVVGVLTLDDADDLGALDGAVVKAAEAPVYECRPLRPARPGDLLQRRHGVAARGAGLRTHPLEVEADGGTAVLVLRRSGRQQPQARVRQAGGEVLDLVPREWVDHHADDALDDLELPRQPPSVGAHADAADLRQFHRDRVPVQIGYARHRLTNVATVNETAGQLVVEQWHRTTRGDSRKRIDLDHDPMRRQTH